MTQQILAGPILRRTTQNRVCVWLATAEKMQLRLTVTGSDKKRLGLGGMDALNPEGIQLGDRLYVHLLQARPDDAENGYPLDSLLYYRIDKISEGTRSSLFSKEELQRIVYGSHPLPSFFIPDKLKNLLHGSCRKPHGRSAAGDALSLGHQLLHETCDDLQRRPPILLLTGDQIYADDVAISLAAVLRQQAVALTGRPEQLPQIGNPAQIPLHGRKHALKQRQSGISSGEAQNHLLSFGEYAAMYLYVFGNLPGWEPVWQRDALQSLGIDPAEEDALKDAWVEQTPYLESFHRTLPDIRRLLANIATYMMFDDHDVTDDWNITHSWYDDVRQSPLGRRVISNALAACWAFQSWGNDPDNFHKDMVWSIQQQRIDQGDDPAVAERYDLYTWKHRGWGYSIPTVPPFIAVDSRTQRQYDDYSLPAQLLDRYALDWLRLEWSKLVSDARLPADTWPVLIAATPVLGFQPIEKLQESALRLVKYVIQKYAKRYLFFLGWFEGPLNRALVNTLDIESWSANDRGYKALFDALQTRMKLPGCLFLSGDVHYAYTATGEFHCLGETFTCAQLTSSALSNMPGEHNQKLLEKVGKKLPRGKLGVRLAWKQRDRWRSESTLHPPEGSQQTIHAEGNIGLVQFADGSPVTHQLLTGHGKRSYRLNLRPIRRRT